MFSKNGEKHCYTFRPPLKPIIWQILMVQQIASQAKVVKELILIAITKKLTKTCLRISSSFCDNSHVNRFIIASPDTDVTMISLY